LIPQENVKDLQEIPENVKSGLEIVPVKWIDQVLDIALERKPMPLPDDETGVVTAAAAAGPGVAGSESIKH
jgi:ATP-dependent Lon protease